MENTENSQDHHENPITEPEIVISKPNLWQTIWHWFDLIAIEKKVTAITSITVKIAIFCTVVAGGLVIYNELNSDSYQIEAFNVPDELAKNGFTGIALANQFNDQIQKIQEIAYVTDPNMQIFAQTNEGNTFELQMVGMALPIQSLINYVGKLTGIDRRQKIRGDLFLSEKTLYIHLQLSNEKTLILEQKMDSLNTKKAVENLLQQATYSTLKKHNPILLGTHLSEIGKQNEAIQIAKYAIYHKSQDRKWALWLWGRALIRQQKSEEAILKFQEVLALDSVFVPAIYSWGSALQRQKKYEESISKRKKAIKLNPDYTPSYNGIGSDYFLKKQYDSAAHWVQEGIKRNPKDGYAYSTLAEIYEIKGDTEKFYDYLELALENGCPLWTLTDQEPYTKYVQEARFQELIEKYRVE